MPHTLVIQQRLADSKRLIALAMSIFYIFFSCHVAYGATPTATAVPASPAATPAATAAPATVNPATPATAAPVEATPAAAAAPAPTATTPATAAPTTTAAPAAAKTAAPAAAKPAAKKAAPKVKLFGSIEFRGPLKALPQWLRVQDKNAQNQILVNEFKLNGGTTWTQFLAKVEGKPLAKQIEIVNAFWNQWPYKQDNNVYKSLDYWAAPYEFRKNSGDCEDYAIVKYFTLRAMGVPMEQMRIVVVKDTILNLAHAILAVYIDDDVFILDNLSKNVLSHTRIKNYIPQYSVNEKNRWMHVMPKK